MTANPGLRADLSQWNTSSSLALEIACWAGVSRRMRVLEPSAGQGALVSAALLCGAAVHAVDVDPTMMRSEELLREVARDHLTQQHADFLTLQPIPPDFDLALMNPPYEGGQDLAHVVHALRFAPRVVALLRLNFLAGQKRRRGLWAEHTLTRLAILSKRPEFEGPGALGAKSDYAVFEIIRGRPDCNRPVCVEWW